MVGTAHPTNATTFDHTQPAQAGFVSLAPSLVPTALPGNGEGGGGPALPPNFKLKNRFVALLLKQNSLPPLSLLRDV